jgi:hypothetical protein
MNTSRIFASSMQYTTAVGDDGDGGGGGGGGGDDFDSTTAGRGPTNLGAGSFEYQAYLAHVR